MFLSASYLKKRIGGISFPGIFQKAWTQRVPPGAHQKTHENGTEKKSTEAHQPGTATAREHRISLNLHTIYGIPEQQFLPRKS